MNTATTTNCFARPRLLAEEGPPYCGGEPEKQVLPESALARLWQKRAARQEGFRTSQGRRVRVLYPGRPGTAAGPDFRNALIQFEDEGLVQGDVEIHIRQQDWYAHGHRDDPNYNGVVLHAALDLSPAPTHRQSGGEVPVVSLASILPEQDVGGDSDGGKTGPTGAVWSVLAAAGYRPPDTPNNMGELLDRAGDARFLGKSGRFVKFLAEQAPEQTLYEGIMESLGYRNNQQTFIRLASLAPYATLGRESAMVPPEFRTAALESWLVELAGLPAERGTSHALLPRKRFGSPMDVREWHCFRVRPANHPRRRIGGAARLLARCFDGTLDGGLLDGLALVADSGSPRRLTAALAISEGGKTYIGADRSKEMAVNVVLPFLHGWAETNGGAERAAACLALYHKFGKLPENGVAREMAEQLFQPDREMPGLNARRQQGLIHLQRVLAGATG